MRNYTFHQPSETAEHAFRRLHQANMVVFTLLGILVLLAIWNAVTLASVIRGASPDLADVGSIRNHISAQLITWVSILTLGVFLFKEWKWGERSLGGMLVLAGLLFLWLVPVMAAEVEPAEEALQLEVTVTYCEPGGIEGVQILDASKCEIAELREGDILMSPSNPMEGDAQPESPDSLQPNLVRWNIVGRGEFTVYYMLRQESMKVCESTRFTSSVSASEQVGHSCVEYDGAVWSVHPYVTSAVSRSWFTIYQEVEP